MSETIYKKGSNMIVTDTMTEHEEDVLEWRISEFLRMGFDTDRATGLAMTKIDLHQMEDLLDKGCAHLTAMVILAGTTTFGDDPHDTGKHIRTLASREWQNAHQRASDRDDDEPEGAVVSAGSRVLSDAD